MGMIGSYYMVDEKVIDEVQSGRQSIDAVLYESEIEESEFFLDVDKAWHAIHYLLCRDPWEGEEPLCNVVLGGKEISKEDVGYGPARFLTPTQVKEAYHAIKDISEDQWKAAYDGNELTANEIYPGIFSDPADDAFDYIWSYFIALREFYKKASDQGMAMILVMS